MTEKIHNVNSIAPLANVANFLELTEKVINSPAHLPSMAVFHGYSGFGKTFSATYAAHIHRALFLQLGYSWTHSKFCDALLEELGCEKKGTIATKTDRIIEALQDTPDRPLIIDEFDYFATEKGVEIVREILDNSDTPIILIGEERLPQKLAVFERFHNRIMAWEGAQPATLNDTTALADLYAKGIKIDPELLNKAFKASGGRVRRVCVNLAMIKEEANNTGLSEITLADWGSTPFFAGSAPKQRSLS